MNSTSSTDNFTSSIIPAKLELCESSLWDPSVSWWAEEPDITPCFQFTIVRLLASYWFWLALPFKLLQFSSQRRTPKTGARRTYALSALTQCKLAACGVLVSASLIEMVYSASQTMHGSVQFLSLSLQLATVLCVAATMRYERHHGFIAGGTMWLYWFLSTLCSGLVAYSAVLNFLRLRTEAASASHVNVTAGRGQRLSGAPRWSADACLLTLALVRLTSDTVAFVLACLADHEVDPEIVRGDSLAPQFGGRASLELSAGVLSRLLYVWMLPIVRRGASKPLEPSDLCALNPADRSDSNAPRFERVHYATVANWRAKQSGLLSGSESPKLVLVMHDDEHRCVSDSEADADCGDAKKEYRRKTGTDVKAGSRRRRYTATAIGGDSVGFWPLSTNKLEKGDANCKSQSELDRTEYPSILRSLLRVYWRDLAVAHLCRLVQDVAVFANAALVGLFIDFVDDQERHDYVWRGVLYVLALTLNQLVLSMLFQRTFHAGRRCGMHMRTAVTTAVYRKSLTVSNAVRTGATQGELLNLMSVDAQRLRDFIGNSWAIWSCPEQIVVACLLIWTQVGVAMLAGLATLALLVIPANVCLTAQQRKLQAAQMRFKDERIKQVNELLAGIRLVKLYAWEVPFCARVSAVREDEIGVLRRAAYLGVVQNFIFTFAPFLITIVTFCFFAAEHALTPRRAFVTLSLFQTLRHPMNILPTFIQTAVSTLVSVKRISRFLAQPDLDRTNVTRLSNPTQPVTLDNVSFCWPAQQQAVLRDVTLHVQRGELLALVGRVGAGKSSLLSAVLGETELIGGRVNVSGRVAYVAQQAWIQNASLRDNVLFGCAFEEKKYRRVLFACALESDLAMLPDGDQTEIGEKGINLSGGQKQRVALARALYADADVYLLDDPLSAVDVHVALHIFNQVIGPRGLLREKTRLFATHGLQWLRHCHRVAVIDQSERRVVQLGPYDQLLTAPDSFLLNHLHIPCDRLQTTTTDNDDDKENGASTHELASSDKKENPHVDENARTSPDANGRKLEEKQPTGRVQFRVYLMYFRAQSLLLLCLCCVTQALVYAFFILSKWWLSVWSEDQRLVSQASARNCTAAGANLTVSTCQDESERGALRHYYMLMYGLIGVAVACATLVKAVAHAVGTLRASRVLHAQMLERLLHAPMRFFDMTPAGRVVNRFSKDVETVDNALPHAFRAWLQMCCDVLFAAVGVCVGTPLATVVFLPAAAIYYLAQHYFIPTTRQLRRLESTSKSPVFTHFCESLQGSATIRAFDACERFIVDAERHTDCNNVYAFLGLVANRCLGMMLDLISTLFVGGAAVFCLIACLNDSTSGGRVGMSLTCALTMARSLNLMMRCNTELEVNLVSVERIQEYAEMEQEAAWERSDADLASDWPAQGEIQLDCYSTRYRPHLDLVLRNVSVRIRPGEKVAIVGRTGAGKSSFTLALFRMVEAANGRILIDGVDIARLGLHQLRGKLTVLPQDPVIFAGTLRANLDPFRKYSDEQVWRALQLAGLHHLTQSMALRFQCADGGSNLSVGQRQLVCLARALLRNTKVLVLDEATAAVDLRTDEFIQLAIRTAFADCTVITIAHRLNTIMNYDRILVLDRGAVVEFDSPAALLALPGGVFASMARQASA